MSQINTEELFEISSILQKGLSSTDTYSAVFCLLDRTVPFQSATIFIYDDQSDKLEPILSKGEHLVDLASEILFSRGKGLSSFLSKQKKPVILPSLSEAAAGRDNKFKSFVSIPLWIGDNLIGVLNLGHDQPDTYLPQDIDEYSKIGSHISLVMEKLNLRTELEDQNKRLHAALENLNAAQEKLVDKERLAAIGEIVVTVNHKINNPLTTIITNAEMLPMMIQINNPEKTKQGSERILRAAYEIQQVTHKLKNLSSSKRENYLDNVKMISLD